MKRIKSIFALVLAMTMLMSIVPAYAASTDWDYMFNSSTKAFATDIEYIDDLGLYVTGGRGFYTSPDGINWTMRAGGLADVKNEIFGFAYGGPEGSEYLVMLLNSASETIKNKIFILDKYLSKRSVVYTYTTDENGDDVDLRLKGVIEWDEYTQKFWCGAALADGTKAGLYYSSGYTGNKMYWTKADTGESALIAETTAYPSSAMTSVLSNITSDGKGHIVAFGVWANKLSSGDAYSKLTNGKGGFSCKTALLVNAEGETVSAQLCDFSKFSTSSGLSTAVIDKNSNIIIQDTSTYRLLVYYGGSFAALWALGNNGQATINSASTNPNGPMKAIKYAIDAISNSKSNCIHTNNMTNALSEIVCFDDKVLLIPRSGQGVGGNNQLSDIFVVTYNADGTLANRFLPFINNTATAAKVIGDYANSSNNMYIADAVAGKNGQMVLITGKHEKDIATEQSYATTISVFETKDTVTSSTATDATTAIPDRTDKITIVSAPKADKTYSHIVASETAFTVTPNTTIEMNAVASAVKYSTDDESATVSWGDDDSKVICYKAVGEVPTGIDEATLEDGEIYVFDDCEPGTYQVKVEAYAEDNETVKNVITYTINVLGDFTSSLNGVYDYNTKCGETRTGIIAGKNTITATCNKGVDSDTCVGIIATYKGNQLISCNMKNDITLQHTLTLAEDADVSEYTYKIMFWNKEMKPL